MWIVDGTIESFYKEDAFRARLASNGDSLFLFSYQGKKPQLTYRALARTIVLSADPQVLKDLFASYYLDAKVYARKLEQERRAERKKKSKLRDRFFSSRQC